MAKLEDVVNAISQGGLISVRFLSESGRIEMEIPDHPCEDAKVEGDGFAFFWAFAACAHGIAVTRTESVGDEYNIFGKTGGQDVCIRVSPVWLGEQRKILEHWQEQKDKHLVRRELKRALAQPSLKKDSPAFAFPEDLVKGSVRVRGSYWAQYVPSEDMLVTAGVLVAGKQKIIFRALPQRKALEAEIARKLAEYADRGFTAGEIFEYLIERSNGVTRSLSEPVRVEARSMEDAAEKLLAKVGAT